VIDDTAATLLYGSARNRVGLMTQHMAGHV